VNTRPKKRVIVIGSGFGGVYTAKHLLPLVRQGDIELVIINQTNYFLFTPLLHEVATGGLSPISVAEPLREVFRKEDVSLIKARVTAINADKQTVECGTMSYAYDYLVCAVGADTNFYDIPGAKAHSLTLKNLYEAMLIRHRIIDLFEEASAHPDPAEKKRLLSFTVVGGGATSVEFVAELAEFAHETMANYYCAKTVSRADVTVNLVSTDNELIKQFHPKLRTKAKEVLERLGVKIRFNTTVKGVETEKVLLGDGSSIPSHTTIWLAGVTPLFPILNGGITMHQSKRLDVDQYLRSTSAENIFVLGDAAASISKNDSRPLPMLAQVAVNQAKTVARNIKASIRDTTLETFTYHSKGSLISVGQWMALGDLFGMQLSGRFTWWLWRTVYLFKFVSWRKRFKIALEWTINLFYPRDITKVV
jgi:NADH dehydrogenase